MKLIDKAAVVAEIEKKLQDLIACKKDAFYPEERITLRAKINTCKEILSFLNTLEVEEVDLDKEIETYFKGFGKFASVGIDDCIDIAKHFFELGMVVKEK